MAEDPKSAQFKVAYHHDASLANGFPASGDISHKFYVATGSKRAVSNKKGRSKQKKNKAAVQTNSIADQAQQPLRQVYQKLPTGGHVQSYTSQESAIMQTQYANLAAQIEAGKSLRMAMQQQVQ